MTISNKLFIAGALIVGLQPLAYGYNEITLNNQITTIEIGIKTLKHYCDDKTVEATRYLRNAVQGSYTTNDNAIIELATILNSNKSLDEKINSILAIKAQEELKSINEEQERKTWLNKMKRHEAIFKTAILTSGVILLAYGIYNDISSAMTRTIMNHDNNLINQIMKRISDNNTLPTPNQQTHWLNYAV